MKEAKLLGSLLPSIPDFKPIIDGFDSMVKKMLFGPWDDEFVVIEPGEIFTLQQFFRPGESTN